MSIQIIKLAERPGERPIVRRRHIKADGRELIVYGHSTQIEAPLPELAGGGPGGELRWHPLRGEWAVYAAARQDRTFRPDPAADPLAPASPGLPATEIPFTDFEIAIFENRFPSFSSSGALSAEGPENIRRAAARGRCEVVVYSPEPAGGLATLSEERRRLLVHAWNDRYRTLFEQGFEYVLPFENRGDEVGVTLSHPHGQIYAFGFVPEPQKRAAAAFAGGFDLAAKLPGWRETYEIARAGGLIAFAPPFARFPYEAWICPERMRPGPWTFETEEIEGFAFLLGDLTRRYDALFGRPAPYMLSLQAAPREHGPEFQFTAQFYPLLRAPDRLKYLAAVEQATGVFTVDVMPERAAAELRAQ